MYIFWIFSSREFQYELNTVLHSYPSLGTLILQVYITCRQKSQFIHNPLPENSLNSEIGPWCPLTNNFFLGFLPPLRKKTPNSRMLTAGHMNNSREKIPRNLDPLVHLYIQVSNI